MPSLFLGFRPFNWKILIKSINSRVWSPKTKTAQTFMNVAIWRKKYIYWPYIFTPYLILTLIQGNRMHGTAMQYVYVCLIQFIKFMNEEESERPPYFISTISIRLRRHSKTKYTFNIRLILEHLVVFNICRLTFLSKSKQPLLLLL